MQHFPKEIASSFAAMLQLGTKLKSRLGERPAQGSRASSDVNPAHAGEMTGKEPWEFVSVCGWDLVGKFPGVA